MTTFYSSLAQHSLVTGGLIALVIFIRICVPTLSGRSRRTLWALIGVSLLLPLSARIPVQWNVSVDGFPLAYESTDPVIQVAGREDQDRSQDSDSRQTDHTDTHSAKQNLRIVHIFTAVWMAGSVILLLYMVISWMLLFRRLRISMKNEKGYYCCDEICQACVAGFFHPNIYIPSSMNEDCIESVLMHERKHIQHHDHIWKPAAFLLLAVYWCNPLFWLGYIFFSRDLEISCDEDVLRIMGSEYRVQYSKHLLLASIKGGKLKGNVAAFCNNGVKERIRYIMKYRQAGQHRKILSAGICLLVGSLCMVKPIFATANVTTVKESDLQNSAAEQTAGSAEISRSVYDDGVNLHDAFGFSGIKPGEIKQSPASIHLEEGADVSWTFVTMSPGLACEIVLIDEEQNEIIQSLDGGWGQGVFKGLEAGEYHIAFRNSESNESLNLNSIKGTIAYSYPR